jgi:hypothetical protein
LRRGREWIDDALCARPPNDQLTWIIEKSFGTEMCTTVTRLLAVCERCEVRRQCLEDSLSATAFTPTGVWGGSTMTERTRVIRQVKKELGTPERVVEWETYAGTGSSELKGSVARGWDGHPTLVAAVADRLEASFDERLQRWQAKADELARERKRRRQEM